MPSKHIRAQIPSGWKMVVEESFNGLNGEKIFVFENDKKQRLYAKLCEPEDLMKGLIWHILSPSELKALKIEESYNQSAYENYYIEESAPEDLWDPEKESLQEYKNRTGRDPKRGSISKEGIEDLTRGEVHIHLGNQGEGEEDIETLRAERDDLKNKLSLMAHQEMNRKIAALKKAGYTGRLETLEDVKNAEASFDADPTRQGSSGTLSLEGNIEGNSEGYDSVEEMIDDLHRRKASGDTPEERETASKILTELLRKAISGKKQKDFKTHVEGKEDTTIKGMNEEWRKRRKES